MQNPHNFTNRILAEITAGVREASSNTDKSYYVESVDIEEEVESNGLVTSARVKFKINIA